MNLCDSIQLIKDSIALRGKKGITYNALLDKIRISQNLGWFIAERYLLKDDYEFNTLDGHKLKSLTLPTTVLNSVTTVNNYLIDVHQLTTHCSSPITV
jgi:hypothetical protein